MAVGLAAIDISWLGPTFRRFFRFWLAGGVASGSTVICEALRFPRMGSSGPAGPGGSTVETFVLEEVVAPSLVFCSVLNYEDARHVKKISPSTGLSYLH